MSDEQQSSPARALSLANLSFGASAYMRVIMGLQMSFDELQDRDLDYLITLVGLGAQFRQRPRISDELLKYPDLSASWKKLENNLKYTPRKKFNIRSQKLVQNHEFAVNNEIAKGMPPFKAWAIKHGLEFMDVLRFMPCNVTRLQSLYDGIAQPNCTELKTFCQEMRLDPLEVVDMQGGDITVSDAELIIDAINHPKAYHNGSVMIYDWIDSVNDWLDGDQSYDELAMLFENISESSANKNETLAFLLKRMLVNDGNPNFADSGVFYGYLMALNGLSDRYVSGVEKCDQKRQHILRLSKEANVMGEFIFQENWPKYHKYISGLLKKTVDGEESLGFCFSTYSEDLSVSNDIKGWSFLRCHFGLMHSIAIKCQQYQVEKVETNRNKMTVDLVLDFIVENEPLINGYEIRQMFLSQIINPLAKRLLRHQGAYGDSNHPCYLQNQSSVRPSPKLG